MEQVKEVKDKEEGWSALERGEVERRVREA